MGEVKEVGAQGGRRMIESSFGERRVPRLLAWGKRWKEANDNIDKSPCMKLRFDS